MSSWLLTFGVLGVVLCAVLAAFGFRGRVSTVGVDLGTTFSVVGVNINGKVSIIKDVSGREIFPSVVAYRPNGEILAGYDALPYLTLDPQNTIFNAKRFIGRSLEDPNVSAYSAHHPFSVVTLPKGISNHSEIGFSVLKDKLVAPEHVGSEVLKLLLRLASSFLGHKQVNKAVIAVPAKFDSAQRIATAAAFKAAGLKVVRVLEEPTAAAVAYNLHKNPKIQHVLVYDFGGGTLDVSLLYVSKGSVQVYATDGDETLGGSDIDVCLFDIVKQKVEQLSEIALSDSNAEKDKSGLPFCNAANLRNAAETSKKLLSSSPTAPVACWAHANVNSNADDKLQSKSESEGDKAYRLTDVGLTQPMPIDSSNDKSSVRVSFSVSRDDLHVGCKELFDRALLPVHRLLADLGMNASDVDEVVLVGGSTRIPRIKQLLREFFGKPLNDEIDPDVTVAYGAASIID